MEKNRPLQRIALSLVLLMWTAAAIAQPIGYGGRFVGPDGKPKSGEVDLEVRFFDLDTAGSQIGPTLNFNDTQLKDGVFQISIDLSPAETDAVLGGGVTWIQIKDKTNNQTLPRQRFLAVPYALKIPINEDVLKYDNAGLLTLKADPVANSILGTNGSGALSWISLTGLGTGDMVSTVWDANTNNKVDNADNAVTADNANELGGQLPAYYTNAANIPETATRKWLSDTERTKLTGLTAGADMLKSTYDTNADGKVNSAVAADTATNATQLNGQAASYYLNATNITSGTLPDAQIPAGIARDAEIAALNYIDWGDLTVAGGGPLSYNNTNGQFSLGSASGVANGYLAMGDFVTFNNKQGAIGGTTDITLDQLTANGDLKLNNDAATQSVTIKALDAATTTWTMTLPDNDGNNLDVLQTNGTGALSWVAIPSAPVASVNTQTGAVVLDTDDVSDAAATNKYFTNALARGAFSGTAPITFNSGTGAIGISAATTIAAGSLSAADKTKLDGITAGADVTNTTTVAAAGAVMDSDYTGNGFIARNGAAGTYSLVTDNSTNWNTAYTDRLKWDGGATGLNVTTAKTSLGYGTMADQNANAVAITGGTIAGVTNSSFTSTGIDDNADALAMTIDSSERLGIGIAVPTVKVHIADAASTGTPVLAIQGTDHIAVQMGDGNSGAGMETGFLSLFHEGTVNTLFGALGDNYILGGNLGIGDSTPEEKLTVDGIVKSKTGGFMFPDGTTQTTSATSGTNNTMDSGFPDAIRCQSASADIILTYLNRDIATGIRHYRFPDSLNTFDMAYTSAGAYSGHNQMTGYDCVTSSYSIATLTSMGRTYNFAKGPAGQWLQSGANAYYNAGNVGIGTSTPTRNLQVASASTAADTIASVSNSAASFPWASVLEIKTATKGYHLGVGGTSRGDGLADKFYIHDQALGTRMVIDSSGYVGIGQLTPAGILDVTTPKNTDTGQPRFLSGSTTVGDWNEILLGAAVTNYKGAFLRYFNGNGTAASSKLSLFHAGDAGDGSGGITVIGGGNVGIGTTGPGYKLEVSTSATGVTGYAAAFRNTANTNSAMGIALNAGSNTTGGATMIWFGRPDSTTIGSITQNSATSISFNATSDRRLKENIADSLMGLDALRQIQVRDYNYILDPEKTEQQGFIAQELYEIYPQAVTVGGEDANKEPWQIDYGKLTPLLVKSVQDLDRENQELRDQVRDLKDLVCADHPTAPACVGH